MFGLDFNGNQEAKLTYQNFMAGRKVPACFYLRAFYPVCLFFLRSFMSCIFLLPHFVSVDAVFDFCAHWFPLGFNLTTSTGD